MIKKIILFSVLLAFISACQSSVKPQKKEVYKFSKINTYIRYMAQRRELQAEMTFKSDSTIHIDGEVLLGERVMTPKKLPVVGLQYKLLQERVNFKSAYNFRYTEKDGSTIDIPVSMNKVQNLRIVSKDGVSKSKGGLLEWDGAPLTQEDGLVFIFSDAEGGTFQLNHTGITKGNKFELLPIHAQHLALGTANLMVTRKKTMVKKDEAGIVRQMHRIEFYFPAITFEVVD